MKKLLILASALTLAACGVTREYRVAVSECSAAAFAKYPTNIQQMAVTRTEYRTEYTGREKCAPPPKDGKDPHRERHFRCSPETVDVPQLVQRIEPVDLNASARNAEIQNCAAQKCVERYGNTACKP